MVPLVWFATFVAVLFGEASLTQSTCSSPEYNGCAIVSDNDDEVGSIDGESSWYHCLNDENLYDDLTNYEIRGIGCYESTDGHSGFQQHNSGPITVNLESCHGDHDYVFDKPIILYLTSYEPVDWIITTSDSIVEENINLEKIYVTSYYWLNSTVTISNDNLDIDSSNIEIIYSNLRGYGSDCGGGNTQGMLEGINSLFGNDIYSFIGAYEYDNVYTCVGKQSQDIVSVIETTRMTETNDIDQIAVSTSQVDGSAGGNNGAVEEETESITNSNNNNNGDSSSSSEDGGRGHGHGRGGHGCGKKSGHGSGGLTFIGVIFGLIVGCVLLKCCCRACCKRNCHCRCSRSGHCGRSRTRNGHVRIMSEIQAGRATNAPEPRNTNDAPKETQTTTQGETEDV